MAETLAQAGVHVPGWGRAQEVTSIVAGRLQAAGALPVLTNSFNRGHTLAEAIGVSKK